MLVRVDELQKLTQTRGVDLQRLWRSLWGCGGDFWLWMLTLPSPKSAPISTTLSGALNLQLHLNPSKGVFQHRWQLNLAALPPRDCVCRHASYPFGELLLRESVRGPPRLEVCTCHDRGLYVAYSCQPSRAVA